MPRHTIDPQDDMFPYTIEQIFASSTRGGIYKRLMVRLTFGPADAVTVAFSVVENGETVGEFGKFSDAVADYNNRP